jgi:hypothetical protein
MKFRLPVILIGLAAAFAAAVQSADAQDAQGINAERARLGNQRIQQDMELRAREEEERRLEAERQSGQQSQEPARQPLVVPEENSPAVAESTAPVPPSSRPGGDSDVSKVLEQLRVLGELKDAGYISEREHTELKQRILDGLN